jgi:predicted DNA-binding transcriptional regulator AlpA
MNRQPNSPEKVKRPTAPPRQATAEELAGFGALPDESFVDEPVLKGLMKVSGPTVWRMTKDGRLPRPAKFGRSARWNVGKLRKALAAFTVAA